MSAITAARNNFAEALVVVERANYAYDRVKKLKTKPTWLLEALYEIRKDAGSVAYEFKKQLEELGKKTNSRECGITERR